jgi:hypothetical protein
MDWVQWLALSGGLEAVASFVTDRLERARSDAAAVYVIVTRYDRRNPEGAKFRVYNDGPLPALSVGVMGWHAWHWEVRRRGTWRLRGMGSWMTGQVATVTVFPTIGPRSSTEEADLPQLDLAFGTGDPPPVMLVFRDGRGRRWVRWPDGRLSRTAPSNPTVSWRCWRLRDWWTTRRVSAGRVATGSGSRPGRTSRSPRPD